MLKAKTIAISSSLIIPPLKKKPPKGIEALGGFNLVSSGLV